MRKNLLVASLVALCVMGMTACSKGEDKNETTTTTTTAMAPQEQAPADQNQVAQPTADASQTQPADAPQAQPEAPQQVSENNQQPTPDQAAAPITTAEAN